MRNKFLLFISHSICDAVSDKTELIWNTHSLQIHKKHLPKMLCACVLTCFSRVQLFETPWTVACQAPLSMGILQARVLEWVAMPSSRGSSQPRDWPESLTSPALAGRFFTTNATWEAPNMLYTGPQKIF